MCADLAYNASRLDSAQKMARVPLTSSAAGII
jgi:hypothetical protein